MTNELTIDTQNKNFWGLSISTVLDVLKTHPENGLSGEEAASRLKIFGLNTIEKSDKTSALLIFFNQFKSPLILILLFAGIVTIFINHLRDSFFIFAAVVINTILGFYQEFKAEKALSELKSYLRQRSRVIRGGRDMEIDASELVPGDIIRLAQGDRVPADARLLFVNDFQADEAILTGESLPVTKTAEPVNDSAVIVDQISMVFAGTLITQGIGTAVVCRTDFSTELGKIASLVSASRNTETPLQKAIKRFSLRIGVALGVLTLAIFLIGIYSGYSAVDMFLTSVAIAVSAVPEGLPIAMTVILAIGVQRMAKRKGVIRKLVAAETLGSATVILTDKTGTLTMGKMELSKIVPMESADEERVLRLALMNTNVIVENPNDPPKEWRMNGRMLELALVKSALTRGVNIEEVRKSVTFMNSLPFNAVNKFSVSLVREQEKHFLVFLGAADILINQSTLNVAERYAGHEKISSLASSGELVIGVATREIKHKDDYAFLEDIKLGQLSFRGFITLHDPVRPSVKDAIAAVLSAGIKIVIMTGDHRSTAQSVAGEVGLVAGANSVIDAEELRTMSDGELKKRVPSLRVIARVSPTDKMRVVRVFQEMGEVVAMTGDGVNDAPSIRQADIGIAMGSGTEVARDVADLVLLDDNFETIAAAVEEGRQIMNNIRKVIVYLLSNVANELLLIGGALLTGLALPLNALQILWVNFFSDSFPAIAFGFEKGIDGLSYRSRSVKGELFDPLMKNLILFIGIFTAGLLFGLYWYLLKLGFDEQLVKTFIFASFGSYSLFLAFSVRSLEKNIFSYSLFSNMYLVGGVGIGFVLMTGAIYMPLLQSVLGTVTLPFNWLLAVILIGILNVGAMEFGKWIFRAKRKPQLI